MKFSENELNDQGVFLSDIYMLNYYDILVFFQVSKTKYDCVYIYELGVKKYKDGYTLLNGWKKARKPLVITENNTYNKTTFVAYPQKDLSLPIQITADMPIYKKAQERVKNPMLGTIYLTKVLDEDLRNYYWTVDEEKYEIKGIA